jgi:glycopeptide antibiotics resistance protein
MVFNRVENIAQIVLNLIGTLFGILFLILIRNNSKIWKWKILAIFSVLFSIFIFLGGLGGYLMNERMKQLPDCIGNTTENCIFRDLE